MSIHIYYNLGLETGTYFKINIGTPVAILKHAKNRINEIYYGFAQIPGNIQAIGVNWRISSQAFIPFLIDSHLSSSLVAGFSCPSFGISVRNIVEIFTNAFPKVLNPQA